MGWFDFLKRKASKPEEGTKEKYWSLTTYEEEILDPTVEQIETAVKNATREKTIFATLSYVNSGLEIESVQAISENNFYRFEALTTDGILYIKNNITSEETLELFTHYYKYQRVSGFRSWPTDTY